jgi:hypothetical protein
MLQLIFAFLISFQSALAANDEGGHGLSMADGIASPSVTTGLVENPAGLHYNRKGKLLFALATPDTDLAPLGLGAGFFGGNGSFGGGLMLQSYIDQGVNSSRGLLLKGGIGFEIPPLNTAFGINAGRLFYEQGGRVASVATTGWLADLGMIINPKGPGRLGIQFYSPFSGLSAVGAGYAHDVSQHITLGIDAIYGTGARAMSLKPAFAVNSSGFLFNCAYGFNVVGDQGLIVRDGFSFGLGIPIGSTLLHFYYSHLAHYYLGLSIGV